MAGNPMMQSMNRKRSEGQGQYSGGSGGKGGGNPNQNYGYGGGSYNYNNKSYGGDFLRPDPLRVPEPHMVDHRHPKRRINPDTKEFIRLHEDDSVGMFGMAIDGGAETVQCLKEKNSIMVHLRGNSSKYNQMMYRKFIVESIWDLDCDAECFSDVVAGICQAYSAHEHIPMSVDEWIQNSSIDVAKDELEALNPENLFKPVRTKTGKNKIDAEERIGAKFFNLTTPRKDLAKDMSDATACGSGSFLKPNLDDLKKRSFGRRVAERRQNFENAEDVNMENAASGSARTRTRSVDVHGTPGSANPARKKSGKAENGVDVNENQPAASSPKINA